MRLPELARQLFQIEIPPDLFKYLVLEVAQLLLSGLCVLELILDEILNHF